MMHSGSKDDHIAKLEAEVARLRKIEAAARAVDFHLPDVWNRLDVEEFWKPLEALRDALEEDLKVV